LVLAAIAGARPELLRAPARADPVPERRALWIYGLVIALVAGALLSPFASALPDGLERVAEGVGFHGRAVEAPVIPAPVPEYAMPGVRSALAATALAGGVGTVLMFGFAWFLARCLVPRALPAVDRAPAPEGESQRGSGSASEGV
jgi:hypothetical protein